MSRAPTRLALHAVRTEGGLLPHDMLQRIALEDKALPGLTPEAYHLEGERLRDTANRAFCRLTVIWRAFQAALDKLPEGDPATTVTRERWLLPLFDALGYGHLAEASTFEIEGKSYAISHAYHSLPIHLLGCRVGLDVKQRGIASAVAASPHGLVQDFLNRSDGHLWGFLSNGYVLRVLRDHHRLAQQAYIELDLQAIFDGEVFSEFLLLWLTAHQSRVEAEKPEESWLEKWYQTARDEGVRALDQLRAGVEAAITALGTGFLRHKANKALHRALETGQLDKQDYYRQLLRLAYRLIFLFVAEERGALLIPGAPEAARARYERYYAIRRLRELAGKRRGGPHGDLWQQLRLVMAKLEGGSPELALPALGSFLWRGEATHDLNALELANEDLLGALRALCSVDQGKARYAVNFRNIGAEDLGSVYESLLELHPNIHKEAARFELSTAAGHERKTTGSYYTPTSLVDCLLDSALDPVLDEAAQKPEPERAILDLKVCDPACGSGHFLIAAARRIAMRLALVRSGGEEPSPPEVQRALRDVVGRCIYGVDLNPMAVELCKISLWMQAIEPGKPLSFLESHIQQGNALLGATPALMAKGIPDEAFEVLEGDDKEVAKRLKKRNKKAREAGQGTRFVKEAPVSDDGRITTAAGRVEEDKDDDIIAVRNKRDDWEQLTASEDFKKARFLANAWCASFMWPKKKGPLEDGAITEDVWRRMENDRAVVPDATARKVEEIAADHSFFHWHLAFPQVFAGDGFDVVLGNPPWIAHAGRAAHPLHPGVKAFFLCNFESFADYPTTHGMFVYVAARGLRPHGYLGLVVPSSLSELGGYRPTRLAHDRLCSFSGELVDFGEGQFPGVTQPCMALVSQRTPDGRTDAAPGEPWPMKRPDLDETARKLLDRLGKLPCLPPELFGERGVQSDKSLAEHFSETAVPIGRFTTPIREGADVREFQLMQPRIHVDRAALGSRIRDAEQFHAVRIVVRQTARYPIAALSDGCAFRNSLLAVFENDAWPAPALVALLNSSLIRWLHYMRFRDARQPVMPQVKIGHLRAIPVPSSLSSTGAEQLLRIGQQLCERNRGMSTEERSELDGLVDDAYELDAGERRCVAVWQARVSGGGVGRETDNVRGHAQRAPTPQPPSAQRRLARGGEGT